MRYSNISRAGTRNTHPKGWGETDDGVQLGGQQFHAGGDGEWFQDSDEIIAMIP